MSYNVTNDGNVTVYWQSSPAQVDNFEPIAPGKTSTGSSSSNYCALWNAPSSASVNATILWRGAVDASKGAAATFTQKQDGSWTASSSNATPEPEGYKVVNQSNFTIFVQTYTAQSPCKLIEVPPKSTTLCNQSNYMALYMPHWVGRVKASSPCVNTAYVTQNPDGSWTVAGGTETGKTPSRDLKKWAFVAVPIVAALAIIGILIAVFHGRRKRT